MSLYCSFCHFPQFLQARATLHFIFFMISVCTFHNIHCPHMSCSKSVISCYCLQIPTAVPSEYITWRSHDDIVGPGSQQPGNRTQEDLRYYKCFGESADGYKGKHTLSFFLLLLNPSSMHSGPSLHDGT